MAGFVDFGWGGMGQVVEEKGRRIGIINWCALGFSGAT
jgi:hypothetical protein